MLWAWLFLQGCNRIAFLPMVKDCRNQPQMSQVEFHWCNAYPTGDGECESYHRIVAAIRNKFDSLLPSLYQFARHYAVDTQRKINKDSILLSFVLSFLFLPSSLFRFFGQRSVCTRDCMLARCPDPLGLHGILTPFGRQEIFRDNREARLRVLLLKIEMAIRKAKSKKRLTYWAYL